MDSGILGLAAGASSAMEGLLEDALVEESFVDALEEGAFEEALPVGALSAACFCFSSTAPSGMLDVSGTSRLGIRLLCMYTCIGIIWTQAPLFTNNVLLLFS